MVQIKTESYPTINRKYIKAVLKDKHRKKNRKNREKKISRIKEGKKSGLTGEEKHSSKFWLKEKKNLLAKFESTTKEEITNLCDDDELDDMQIDQENCFVCGDCGYGGYALVGSL